MHSAILRAFSAATFAAALTCPSLSPASITGFDSAWPVPLAAAGRADTGVQNSLDNSAAGAKENGAVAALAELQLSAESPAIWAVSAKGTGLSIAEAAQNQTWFSGRTEVRHALPPRRQDISHIKAYAGRINPLDDKSREIVEPVPEPTTLVVGVAACFALGLNILGKPRRKNQRT